MKASRSTHLSLQKQAVRPGASRATGSKPVATADSAKGMSAKSTLAAAKVQSVEEHPPRPPSAVPRDEKSGSSLRGSTDTTDPKASSGRRTLSASTSKAASSRTASVRSTGPPTRDFLDAPKAASTRRVVSLSTSKSNVLPSSNKAVLAPAPATLAPPITDNGPLCPAAQIYAWLFMHSTLASTARAASVSAEHTLLDWEGRLNDEERDIADDIVRERLYRVIDTLDELASSMIVDCVPALFGRFLYGQRQCKTLLDEALRIRPLELDARRPVHSRASEYHSLITKLCGLQRDLSQLARESRQVAITLPAESTLRRAMEGLAEVMEEDIASLSVGTELVDLRREDEGIRLHEESLKLSIGR